MRRWAAIPTLGLAFSYLWAKNWLCKSSGSGMLASISSKSFYSSLFPMTFGWNALTSWCSAAASGTGSLINRVLCRRESRLPDPLWPAILASGRMPVVLIIIYWPSWASLAWLGSLISSISEDWVRLADILIDCGTAFSFDLKEWEANGCIPYACCNWASYILSNCISIYILVGLRTLLMRFTIELRAFFFLLVLVLIGMF